MKIFSSTKKLEKKLLKQVKILKNQDLEENKLIIFFISE